MSFIEASKLIYKGNETLIYKGAVDEFPGEVAFKVFNKTYPEPFEIVQFNEEYKILHGLEHAHIRNAYRTSKVDGKHVLFLEYVKGETLSSFLNNKPVSLKLFFNVALQLVDALDYIHKRNIIHKDLSPENILVNPEDYGIKLIDFGLATKLSLKHPFLESPKKIQGNLQYISPEQTGRMNRDVDYRSDFYSLGVIFYKMLTAKCPFESENPLELIHLQIAKHAISPEKINEDIPLPLAQLILKLLSKNAEDRYQSTFGLKHDLTFIETNWNPFEGLTMTLAEDDFSGRFQLSQKLYGRDKEINQLLEIYDRVSAGTTGHLFVGGASGSGKSALIQEVYRSLSIGNGRFVSGKFDQYQRNIPYFAWSQALNEFTNQLLAERDDVLATWKNNISSALGSNGQLLIDLIPNLIHLIGPQPDVPILLGEEAQNRFNYVFHNFIQSIANLHHPLVIFLDDLQWADLASLNLLQVILTSDTIRSLFIVGAYRNNEVDTGHPFQITLNNVESELGHIDHFSIGSLKEEHVQALIADTLNHPKAYRNLASLVYKKTQGNAFYVRSFLRSLYQDGLLHYDFHSRTWLWDKSEVKAIGISENVGQFIASSVQKLRDDTQNMLKLASCIGSVFNAEDLAIIAHSEIYALQDTLNDALEEGVIFPLREQTFRFAHDQILQAIYALIETDERNKIHLNIGRLLLEHIPLESRDEYLAVHIFDIVNQFNFGIPYLEADQERKLISQLNLQAGQKALNSSAYETSFNYFKTGIQLLDDNSWQNDYTKTHTLYTAIVQTAALCNRTEELAAYSELTLSNARSTLDKIPVYEVNIRTHTALNNYKEAIRTGTEVLELLGEKFPKKPNKFDVVKYLIKTKLMLFGKSIAGLGDQPMMTDPVKKAANSLIVNMGTAAMFGNPALLPLFAMRVVQLAIKYGNTLEIPRGYAGMAMILCGGVGDIKTGSQFGKLGLKTGEKIVNNTTQVSAIQIYNTCIQHYTEHAVKSLAPLKQAYVKGLETGDLESADFSLANYYFQRYFTGDNLQEFENEFKEACFIIEKHKQTQVHNLSLIYYATTQNLIKSSEEPWKLIGEFYDERIKLPIHLKNEDATALFLFYYHKLTLAYIFEEYAIAESYADKARTYIEGGISLMPSIFFWAYDSLIRCALIANDLAKPTRHDFKVIRKNQKQLKKFARYAPDNYQHLYDLVEAVRASLKGQNDKARTLYDMAISRANKTNYKNIEAIASELAGRFHQKIGKDLLSDYYFEHAHTSYFQWGAIAKLNHFSVRHENSLLKVAQLSNAFSKKINTQSAQLSHLDVSSVMEASQTIASEISIDKLLGGIMKVMIQNAGAEKGLLILKGDNRWYLECQSSMKDIENPKTLLSIPVEEVGGSSSNPLISLSIFDYVVRTQKSVVLEDAFNIGNFTNSEYVKTNRPKSVLCSPLLKQGRLIGCVYLENNLTTGAFTPDRMEILSLLSSQIAISIENARLYENLEEKVRNRTNALVAEKEKTEKAYKNIKMLSFIGQQINSSLSMEKIIDTVYDHINQIMDADTFGIGFFDSFNQSITYKNAIQNGNKIEEFVSSTQDEHLFSSWCYQHKQEISIPDIQHLHQTQFSKLVPDVGQDARSIIYLPLVTKDEVKGVITVQSQKASAYSPLHLDILKNLAIYTATAIAHADEYERSERLLLNILPRTTAQELKEKGTASSKSYKMASILFTDFKGFTKIAEKMSPEEVVENLDFCFKAFDRIAAKHGLEKIKTIGDSYMCAGGIPIPNTTNPVDTVNAAIEMMEFMNTWKATKIAQGLPTWEVRLGINTGKVVAGVVGEKKFAYDIWGDAVNTASRMESSGESGKINISGATYELVKPFFYCTYRGKIKAKNKGEIDMYFVDAVIN